MQLRNAETEALVEHTSQAIHQEAASGRTDLTRDSRVGVYRLASRPAQRRERDPGKIIVKCLYLERGGEKQDGKGERRGFL